MEVKSIMSSILGQVQSFEFIASLLLESPSDDYQNLISQHIDQIKDDLADNEKEKVEELKFLKSMVHD